ncbi:MAG: tRNA lysidine(34) synthetase TilS [Ruminococcaceae bacterium]|nr:tRNA lysidine(34) synthetase TilS [Oscillospiraceae bacterium]
MLRDIINNFNRTVNEYDMIPAGCTVVAGISGGADSVCLLLLLCEYRFNKRFNLIAAHYNHKLRGAEADADERFTRNLCKTLNVQYISAEGDVAGYAKAHGMGHEEAARYMRYNFLRGEAEKHEGDVRIAIAHNQNDRVETILHNISRGTSLEGLKGISFIRGNIIRPLLNLTRAETECVCNEYGVLFRIDSTNIDCKYKRNRIRGNVIPYMTDQLGADFVSNVLRMSELASEDNRFIKSIADKAYFEMARDIAFKTRKNTQVEIDAKLFSREDRVIQSRIVRSAISRIKDKNGEYVFPEGTGLGSVTTERVRQYILRGKTGGYIEIGKGTICRFSYGKVVFGMERQTKKAEDNIKRVDELDIILYKNVKKLCSEAEKEGVLKNISFSVSLGEDIYNMVIDVAPVTEYTDFSDYISDKHYVCFDSRGFFEFCDEHGIPIIRTKEPHDIISAFGVKGRKKLSRFYIDNKVPVADRDMIPLLASGRDVLWIHNMRRSNIAPVKKESKSVIIMTLKAAGSENLTN